MGFVDDVISGLERLSRTSYNSVSDMANKIGAAQSVLWKLMNRKAHPRADILGGILDSLGARIVFPDEGKIRDCVFVQAPKDGSAPNAGAFKGVAVYPLDMVPSGNPVSWLLLGASDPALLGRDRVVAVLWP